MITFARPYILFALWIVPLLVWLWISLYRKKEKQILKFISRDMQSKLRFTISRKKLTLQIVALIVGLILLIISVAGPFKGYNTQQIKIPTDEIVIVLDVSRSMNATDIKPSRIGIAKNILQVTTQKLRNDYIALITFRKNTIINSPLTTDHSYLINCITQASMQSVPPGETDIGTAIITAANLFNTNTTSRKIIILVSDGEDMAGNINKAEHIIRQKEITLFSVGIGTENGAIIPHQKENHPFVYNGKKVITRIHPEILQKLANAGNGKYIAITNNRIPGSQILSAAINKIKREEISAIMIKSQIYKYNVFLLPAFFIFLLIIITAIPAPPPSNKVAKKIISAVIIITALHPEPTYAANTSNIIKQYNLASKEFSNGNSQQAITRLDKIKDNYDEAKIDTAYGCIFFRLAEQSKQLQEKYELYKKAAEYFQIALYHNHDNKKTEHNLAISYKKMLATAHNENAIPAAKYPAENNDTHQAAKQTNNTTKTKTSVATETPKQMKEFYYKNITEKEINNILSLMLNREKSYKDRMLNRTAKFNPNLKDW